ncbi:hypothetical protein [Fodinicola acaciae]|uniref:hypothetical protein n=1 Tax=Fodinicola acaciae TaxID=2681555 RepID=UPI0013CFF9DE|nr:hypothetical protein [Fodinicola acaciae]
MAAGSEDALAGWLLRINRMAGVNPSYRQATRFIADFPGGCWQAGADSYKVSRWETGAIRVPYLAVRRYEELLRLESNQLVSVIDAVNRYLAPSIVAMPRLERRVVVEQPADHERLAVIVDRVYGDDPVSGDSWDSLSAFLASNPGTVILRSNGVWSAIAERLLAELVIATGRAWTQRYEAFSRLLAHPIAQAAAVDACAQLGRDPTNQVFIDTLSVLDASPHPAAGHELVRQIANAVNDRARYGALLGSERKLRLGHFAPADRAVLERLLRDLATSTTCGDAHGDFARHLLQQVQPDRTSAAHNLDQAPAADAVVARLVLKLAGDERLGEAATRDALLPTLLHEGLYSPSADTQLYAALLLRASPYRHPLARAVGNELRASRLTATVGTAIALVNLFCLVGGPADGSVLIELLTRRDVPLSVKEAAALRIGHVVQGAPGSAIGTLLDFYLAQWQRQRASSVATIIGDLGYSIGVAGDEQALHRLAAAEAPAESRRAARWYRDIPRAVRISAQT